MVYKHKKTQCNPTQSKKNFREGIDFLSFVLYNEYIKS